MSSDSSRKQSASSDYHYKQQQPIRIPHEGSYPMQTVMPVPEHMQQQQSYGLVYPAPVAEEYHSGYYPPPQSGGSYPADGTASTPGGFYLAPQHQGSFDERRMSVAELESAAESDEHIEVDGKFYYDSGSKLADLNGVYIEVDGQLYYESIMKPVAQAPATAYIAPSGQPYQAPEYTAPSPAAAPIPGQPSHSSGSGMPLNPPVAPSPALPADAEPTPNDIQHPEAPLQLRLRILELFTGGIAAIIATVITNRVAGAAIADVSTGYQTFYTTWSFLTIAYAFIFVMVRCLVACARRTRTPKSRLVGEVVGDLIMLVGWVVVFLGVIDVGGSGNSLRSAACDSSLGSADSALVCGLSWTEVVVGVLLSFSFLCSLGCSLRAASRSAH